MTVRRAAIWVSTVLVAIVVAFTVPVSQLRMASLIATCCCPDPDNCHCPDHQQPDPDSQPTIQECHKSAKAFESAVAPIVALASRIEIVPVRAAIRLHQPLLAPHASPILERPRGPS